MIDLDRYISATDFLMGLEEAQEVAGSQGAVYRWLHEHVGLDREDMNYVLEGFARLRGDFKAEGWEPGREELDRIVWAFHRGWVDRYGWAPTNDAGLERWRTR